MGATAPRRIRLRRRRREALRAGRAIVLSQPRGREHVSGHPPREPQRGEVPRPSQDGYTLAHAAATGGRGSSKRRRTHPARAAPPRRRTPLRAGASLSAKQKCRRIRRGRGHGGARFRWAHSRGAPALSAALRRPWPRSKRFAPAPLSPPCHHRKRHIRGTCTSRSAQRAGCPRQIARPSSRARTGGHLPRQWRPHLQRASRRAR
mmetsp:Transcript_40956/g.135669  ORF Transcript_40956/g.135669 Transcript_40956/m.135669 type:complete len:205 (+) Transcript_40956:2343-2957(+)